MAKPEKRVAHWAKAAVQEEKPRAQWHRPLRMATDCSGAATPELAWQGLKAQSAQVPRVNHIWACDIAPGPRAWIRRILPSIILFTDVVQREYPDKQGIRGEVVGAGPSKRQILRAEANLDVYIAGFMCSPWSPKGKREGFAAEAAKTFFNVLRTIVVMRPRCVILENVPQILDQAQELITALEICKGYEYKVLKFQTANFGIPHNRERIYIIMLRTDAVVHSTRQAFSNIARVMAECTQPAPCSWSTWLKKIGLPVTLVSADSPGFVFAKPCAACSAGKVCPEHICKCKLCTDSKGAKTSAKKKSCAWRANVKTYLTNKAKAAKTYLKQWRVIKKDPLLKKPPSYWELAASLDLRVPERMASSPSMRAKLDAVSAVKNIMTPTAIMDSSQSVSRVSLRTDGMVPCLTTTCEHLYVPRAGVCLTGKQCLALQGFETKNLPVDEFANSDIANMAGMAMSMPVVGTLLWAVVCQIDPQ